MSSNQHNKKKEKPRCDYCNELILEDECTEAEGKVWHINHFCCTECKRPLGGQQYIMSKSKSATPNDNNCNNPGSSTSSSTNGTSAASLDGTGLPQDEARVVGNDSDSNAKSSDSLPYCLVCFDILFAELCEECGELIGCDVGAISHDNRSWHARIECFKCNSCLKPLLGAPFLPANDGKIYCSVACSQAASSLRKQKARQSLTKNRIRSLSKPKCGQPPKSVPTPLLGLSSSCSMEAPPVTSAASQPPVISRPPCPSQVPASFHAPGFVAPSLPPTFSQSMQVKANHSPSIQSFTSNPSNETEPSTAISVLDTAESTSSSQYDTIVDNLNSTSSSNNVPQSSPSLSGSYSSAPPNYPPPILTRPSKQQFHDALSEDSPPPLPSQPPPPLIQPGPPMITITVDSDSSQSSSIQNSRALSIETTVKEVTTSGSPFFCPVTQVEEHATFAQSAPTAKSSSSSASASSRQSSSSVSECSPSPSGAPPLTHISKVLGPSTSTSDNLNPKSVKFCPSAKATSSHRVVRRHSRRSRQQRSRDGHRKRSSCDEYRTEDHIDSDEETCSTCSSSCSSCSSDDDYEDEAALARNKWYGGTRIVYVPATQSSFRTNSRVSPDSFTNDKATLIGSKLSRKSSSSSDRHQQQSNGHTSLSDRIPVSCGGRLLPPPPPIPPIDGCVIS